MLTVFYPPLNQRYRTQPFATGTAKPAAAHEVRAAVKSVVLPVTVTCVAAIVRACVRVRLVWARLAAAFSGLLPMSKSVRAIANSALSLAHQMGVATLAKSAKMVPVMIGTILFGEAKYSVREYLQVLAIVAGTALVALSKKKGGGDSSPLGAAFIVGALVLDGVTGGMQNKIRARGKETKKVGKRTRVNDE